MPQGIGYPPPTGMLGAGMDPRPPAPGVAPQQPWTPQNNVGMGANLPVPVVNDHAMLQLIMRMMAGK